MSSYRELKVWQQSLSLAREIYVLTSQLPATEKYGITSQLQRCAVSIPSNIAEGQQCNGNKEFMHFLSIARGSAAELYTQLLLIHDIYQIDTKQLVIKTEEIQKMLYSPQNKL